MSGDIPDIQEERALFGDLIEEAQRVIGDNPGLIAFQSHIAAVMDIGIRFDMPTLPAGQAEVPVEAARSHMRATKMPLSTQAAIVALSLQQFGQGDLVRQPITVGMFGMQFLNPVMDSNL